VLDSADGTRWYKIDCGGGKGGSLSFGTLDEDGNQKGKGTLRPKQFESVREARRYFEKYVKDKGKGKAGYVPSGGTK
jgi:hypothetical protein